ncbi:MAG: hypothetical protein RIR33_1303 [Pseudomonadota bacterium]|jgi:hypothetical protein
MIVVRAPLIVVALALLLGHAPAHADIRSFNAAVAAGDYRGATVVAGQTWPTVDRASPSAAQVAREFGWIAMLAGEPASALIYSRFLVEQGGGLPYPDSSPAVSRVLHDWASMESSASPQARANLMQSLYSRATGPGRDLVSPRAAQALFAEAWAAGDWSQAESAAMYAIRFLDDLQADRIAARYEARRSRAMASFMRTKSPDAYTTLYDIAGEVHDLIVATPQGPGRLRLAIEYYAATAWADAIYGGLGSRQRDVADRRQSIGTGRPALSELLYPAPGDPTLPRCRIALARGAEPPGFPFVSRFKELAGSVTYAVDVSPGGALVNPRLLAWAPHSEFVRATEAVQSSWRWRIDGSAQPPACRVPQVHIVTFEFALGR